MSTEAPQAPATPDIPEADAGDEKKSQTKPRLNPPEGGFQGVPEEWNPTDYAPMRKGDFANPIHYHEWKLAQLEEQADKHRQQIELIKVYGSDEDAIKKARRDQKIMSGAKELLESGSLPPDVMADLFSEEALEELLNVVKSKKAQQQEQ